MVGSHIHLKSIKMLLESIAFKIDLPSLILIILIKQGKINGFIKWKLLAKHLDLRRFLLH